VKTADDLHEIFSREAIVMTVNGNSVHEFRAEHNKSGIYRETI
jgi:hypothetical protein